jgi:DnaJ-class molecular chaperone
MAIVSVSSRVTYWAGVVAHVACNSCMGEAEQIDRQGFHTWCNRCEGTGKADMGSELRYATARSARFKAMGLRRRFDGVH